MGNIVSVKNFLYADKRSFLLAFGNNEDAVNKYLLGVCNTLVTNPDLLECTPESIRDAAVTSAVLDVPIDARQYAYLVPYSKKAQFQLSYKGYIHIAKRDPDVDNVTSTIVYSQDEFSFDVGANAISHVPNLDSPSYGSDEDIKFIYAVVRFKQNTGRASMFEVMTKKQIDKIKDGAKQQYVWRPHYGEMGRKTVIKRLLKHAQLGDVATFDQIDNAIENNQIINVTPGGELLVNNDDLVLKDKIIEEIAGCDCPLDMDKLVAKHRDGIEEFALYNVKYSKEINAALIKKADAIYIEAVKEFLCECDNEQSLDNVYEAHDKRIDMLKAKDKKDVISTYCICKQSFIDATAI